MPTMHLFTYGSLMFPQVWSRVVRGDYRREAARLYGYQRRAIRGESYPAAIAASSHDLIDGQLYMNVGAADMARLDEFEGEDYRRVGVPLTLGSGKVITVALYLYRHHHRLEAGDWDVAWFEREGMGLFLAQYGGFLK